MGAGAETRPTNAVHGTTRSPSLLDLPVELLSSIFQHLQTHSIDSPNVTSGPPYEYLFICRSLYPLIHALRLRRLQLPVHPYTLQSKLAALIRLPAAFQNVQDVRVSLSCYSFSELVAANLALFKILRTLRVELDLAKPFSQPLFDTLAGLPCLQAFEMVRSPHDGHRSPWPSSFQRPLEQVSVPIWSLQNGFLKQFLVSSRVKNLAIRVNQDYEIAILPWLWIDTLTLEFTDRLEHTPTLFLASLEEQLEMCELPHPVIDRSSSLRHLVVDIHTKHFDLTILLQRIRAAFKGCRLQTLRITSSQRGFDITKQEWAWPTLTSLELVMPITGIVRHPKSFKHTMSTLYTAITQMPHLTHLTLANVHFVECDCCRQQTVDDILAHGDDSLARTLTFPALMTFVGLLRAGSAVLDFRIRSSVGALEEGREARWTRKSGGEDFALEGRTVVA
ncbi:hypothetical protein JCM10908_006302 [Rhodotorula pacifica]|uniref:uncharacterized protein n=1 Tax=Rhodotorula pacifica TaxID=1495444 RepID=UPI00317A8064